MKAATQRITLLAVGIALFVALSLCLQVPVFENYYLCLGYVVMAVYCYSFGTLSGTIVGTLGVVLYCVVINGFRGMPGWALGNVVIGIALGLTFRATRQMRSAVLRTALNIAAIAAGTALGILIVKSATESLLYAQLMAVRIGKNVTAFVADLVVLAVSLPVCLLVDPTARKLFPQLAAGPSAREQ
ncbi:MAG: ECF transporter S component [Clostridia bacterium]|nr:ECF transporter S component [Clostridia bacterium]